jgi:anti-sigma factor RsiW
MSQLASQLKFWRDHRWAPPHMSAYLDGEMESSEVRRMQRHTGECRDCRRLLASLRRMLTALGRLEPSTGEADAAQIAAAVHLRLAEPPSS